MAIGSIWLVMVYCTQTIWACLSCFRWSLVVESLLLVLRYWMDDTESYRVHYYHGSHSPNNLVYVEKIVQAESITVFRIKIVNSYHIFPKRRCARKPKKSCMFVFWGLNFSPQTQDTNPLLLCARSFHSLRSVGMLHSFKLKALSRRIKMFQAQLWNPPFICVIKSPKDFRCLALMFKVSSLYLSPCSLSHI